MLSSIFFDLRSVYGSTTLLQELQNETLEQSRKASIFLAYMAANALTHKPPLGFFRRFVLINDGEHNEAFDIKHRGIVPITDIARQLALSEGIPATNTTERLLAVGRTKALSDEMSENLLDALAFIAELRICHQARQIRRGLATDNYLSPNKLSELDRKHLKDAFGVIQEMQNILEHRYQTGRLG
jgi:CBS domain-containing protein